MKNPQGHDTSIPAKPKSSWRMKLAALGMMLLTLFLVFVGSTLAMDGIKQMATALSLKQAGIERIATVTRIDTTFSILGYENRRQVVSLPVMEFDYQGRRYEFTAQAVSGVRRFEVGEQVMVVFPEGDLDAAVLREFRNDAWAIPLALGVVLLVGAMLLGWAAWMMSFGHHR